MKKNKIFRFLIIAALFTAMTFSAAGLAYAEDPAPASLPAIGDFEVTSGNFSAATVDGKSAYTLSAPDSKLYLKTTLEPVEIEIKASINLAPGGDNTIPDNWASLGFMSHGAHSRPNSPAKGYSFTGILSGGKIVFNVWKCTGNGASTFVVQYPSNIAAGKEFTFALKTVDGVFGIYLNGTLMKANGVNLMDGITVSDYTDENGFTYAGFGINKDAALNIFSITHKKSSLHPDNWTESTTGFSKDSNRVLKMTNVPASVNKIGLDSRHILSETTLSLPAQGQYMEARFLSGITAGSAGVAVRLTNDNGKVKAAGYVLPNLTTKVFETTLRLTVSAVENIGLRLHEGKYRFEINGNTYGTFTDLDPLTLADPEDEENNLLYFGCGSNGTTENPVWWTVKSLTGSDGTVIRAPGTAVADWSGEEGGLEEFGTSILVLDNAYMKTGPVLDSKGQKTGGFYREYIAVSFLFENLVNTDGAYIFFQRDSKIPATPVRSNGLGMKFYISGGKIMADCLQFTSTAVLPLYIGYATGLDPSAEINLEFIKGIANGYTALLNGAEIKFEGKKPFSNIDALSISDAIGQIRLAVAYENNTGASVEFFSMRTSKFSAAAEYPVPAPYTRNTELGNIESDWVNPESKNSMRSDGTRTIISNDVLKTPLDANYVNVKFFIQSLADSDNEVDSWFSIGFFDRNSVSNAAIPMAGINANGLLFMFRNKGGALYMAAYLRDNQHLKELTGMEPLTLNYHEEFSLTLAYVDYELTLFINGTKFLKDKINPFADYTIGEICDDNFETYLCVAALNVVKPGQPDGERAHKLIIMDVENSAPEGFLGDGKNEFYINPVLPEEESNFKWLPFTLGAGITLIVLLAAVLVLWFVLRSRKKGAQNV